MLFNIILSQWRMVGFNSPSCSMPGSSYKHFYSKMTPSTFIAILDMHRNEESHPFLHVGNCHSSATLSSVKSLLQIHPERKMELLKEKCYILKEELLTK